MPAGFIAPGWQPPKPSEKKPLYPAAVEQQGQDYDEIMNRYRRIADSPEDPRINNLIRQYETANRGPGYSAGPNFTPQTQTYKRSGELSGAFAQLRDLAETGGLSEQARGDMRARGISPIRSIYANMQQNMSRRKALQGGYSPNFNAASSRMARESSDQIADQVTDVNARIAELVQQGRLSAAPQYAAAAQRETSEMGGVSRYNADQAFQAAQFNESNRQRAHELNQASNYNNNQALERLYGQQNNQRLQATEGMRGLYGTTPALPALYGQQGMQQQQLNMQQQQQKQQQQQALMDAYMRQRTGSGGFSLGGRR